jgi:flagellar hook-length control protein FliK
VQLIPLLQTGAPVGQRTTLAAAGSHVSFAAAFDKLAASDTAKTAPTDVDTPDRSDTAPTGQTEDDPTDANTLPVGMEESEDEDSLDSPPMPVGLDPTAQHAKTNAETPSRPGSESRLIYAVQFDGASQSSAGAIGSDAGTGGAAAIVAHRETAELMMRPADHGPDAPQSVAPSMAATADMRETATVTDKTAPVLHPLPTMPADGLDRAGNKPVFASEHTYRVGSTLLPSQTAATASDAAIRVNATPAHGDSTAAGAARQHPSPRETYLSTHAPAVPQSAAPIPQSASGPTDARLENQQQTPIATVIIRTMASPAQTADGERPTTADPAAPQHSPTNPGTVQPTVTRNIAEPRLAPTQPLTAVSAANPSTDLERGEGQIETALADIRTPGPTSVQSHIPTAQAAPQHLHATLAKQIAEAAQNGSDRQIELTLSPAELGKVRMSLSTTDAGVSVLIHADRPETLDLMRRNIGDLESEFADMGYGDVDFAFSGGDDAQDQRGDHPQSQGTPSHADGTAVGTTSNVSGGPPLSPETSMDIRI